ncbi:MAG: anaerobic ribonucleoside-triphosphate reductase activating protein [Firmicutes bacterium]|nr:anaerobic ribonucleoside-triphosphate reductase activating protein [Bacillota bacterium]
MNERQSLLHSTIRLSGVVPQSVVDGTGLRFTLFTQGCPHRCPQCQNPHTHAYGGGKLYKLDDLAALYKKNPLLDGVTFSGGEPFCHPAQCAAFARTVKEAGGSVWCYSGYTLEQLTEAAKKNPAAAEFLQLIDVLVDGRYIHAQKNHTLKFVGSDNQRIIDLKQMRENKSDQIILYPV